jgi:hypothetical protein
MTMKRFLILFTLSAFLTVSCAGAKRIGWTKPDFDPNEFSHDREECARSIDRSLVSEAFGRALEECLGKKGYEYRQSETETKESKPTTGKTVLLTVGYISLGAALVALMVLAAAAGGAGAGLGGLGR